MPEKRSDTPPLLVKVLCVVVIVACIAFLIFFAPSIDHESSQGPRDVNSPLQHPAV
jgi:hypothetical protein